MARVAVRKTKTLGVCAISEPPSGFGASRLGKSASRCISVLAANINSTLPRKTSLMISTTSVSLQLERLQICDVRKNRSKHADQYAILDGRAALNTSIGIDQVRKREVMVLLCVNDDRRTVANIARDVPEIHALAFGGFYTVMLIGFRPSPTRRGRNTGFPS